MPFARPTLAALVERIRNDFRSRVSGLGPLLRRATEDVLAVVWAGAVHMLHGHLEWLARQIFADQSDDDVMLRQAAMYGITPTAATFASGTVTATGGAGSVIDHTTAILVRSDGVRYEVTADAVIGGGGTAAVSVRAVEAGAAGNLAAGELLSWESPIAGVDGSATVAAGGLAGGNDQESADGTRARFLLRLREPPEGGAEQDYEAWALAVAGVTRAWVYPNEDGLGTVAVRFVRDNDVGGILPDAGEVAAVQAALDAERPITAVATAKAPTALAVAFTIHLVATDLVAAKAAVAAELADLFFREGAPGDGAGRGTIKLSHIHTAIGTAAGVSDYTLTVPAADVVPALGQLVTVGVITWT